MKNCRWPLLIAVFFVCPVFYVLAQDEPVTAEFLTGSEWGPAHGGPGYWLNFNADQTYSAHFAAEGGGPEVSGRYALEKGKITLTVTATVNPGELPAELRKPVSVWTTAKDTSNLRFTVKLIAGDRYAFWRMKSLTREGDIRRAGGYTIVIGRHQTMVTNDNARVRKGPGRKFEYSTFTMEGATEPTPYLPKSSAVTVIGRGTDRETIDGVTDFWFYCDTNLGWYSAGPKEGWIFGALLSELPSR